MLMLKLDGVLDSNGGFVEGLMTGNDKVGSGVVGLGVVSVGNCVMISIGDG